MQRVFIYGAGRVGRGLGRALEANGAHQNLELSGAWNRSFRRALETSLILNTEVSSGDVLPDQIMKADIVVLSVVDDAIASLSEGLGRHLSHRQILLHTSGSLPSTLMRHSHMKAQLGCCHPLQSIAKDDGDFALFKGSTFAIEGQGEALDAATRLARVAGGNPITIKPEGKVYYHAAAVVSANYLTVLVDAAQLLYRQAGLDTQTAVQTLLPLLRGTLQNLEEACVTPENPAPDGPTALAKTLTGPVRRGDVKTVKRHLKALRKLAKSDPDASQDLVEMYCTLGRRATRLAKRAGLDQEAAQKLNSALKSKT